MGFVSSLVLSVLRLATCLLSLVLRLFFKDGSHQFDNSVTLLPEYEFIVVGSGGAGSVVAGRLSEVGASVLLLEAGGSAPPVAAVPGLAVLTCIDEQYGWNLKTAPMKNTSFIFENNQQVILQGRVMGGSTTINGMNYIRGFKKDFDNWAQLGNTGWDYQSVLPCFKKLENYLGAPNPTTDEFMGHEGPLSLTPGGHFSSINEAFLKAGQELGFEAVYPNGPTSNGFYSYHKATQDGVRVTTAEAFVRPNIHRPGFHVRVNSHVTKILFDDQKRAIGVMFRTNRGQEQTVRASKEVIVSAGVFQSPKLLMLSGIGPADHLREMKIPVVADVEGVGRNLMDHHCVKHLSFSVKPGTSLDPGKLLNVQSVYDYFKNRNGPLTIAAGNEGQAYVNVDDPEDDWPNIFMEMVGMTLAKTSEDLVSYGTGIHPQAFGELYSSVDEADTISLVVALARPYSRGRVTLRSADPFDNPVIDPNMLDDPRDVETLLKGIKFAMKLKDTTAMQTLLEAQYIHPNLSACAHLEPFSDDYWRCYIRQTMELYLHTTGTCQMAPDTNPLGVVSSTMKVRGVDNLRVIDASVMPQGVSTSIMATTIMIGERGADFIKEDWGYPTLHNPVSVPDGGSNTCSSSEGECRVRENREREEL